MRLKAENALAASDDARKKTALEAILKQVARLDTLLRNLLQMTQAGEPKSRDVELASFLQSTIEPHQELAAANGLSLEAGIPEPNKPMPHFDPFQMQRALDNLILNAIQNTPAGGHIVVDALRQQDRLLLCVTDNGAGVSEEMRERLFEPFVTARSGGTGLGLAIVREIARAHHGEARLARTERGARFEIEVPWQTS